MQSRLRNRQPARTPVLARPKQSRPKPSASKKERILELYRTGMTNVAELALAVNSQSGYVARVLTEAGLLSGYFDLYTTSTQLMNFYSYFSRGIVRFKTPKAARASVARIDRLYRDFDSRGDRAGQHHAEVMALIGMNRALSCGKRDQAHIFARWLMRQLRDV